MTADNEDSTLESTLEVLARATKHTNSLLKTLIESSASENTPNKPNRNERSNSLCLSSSDLRAHHSEPHSHFHRSSLGGCQEVLVKFGFLEIYQISTKSQTFNAEVLIQLRWLDEAVEDLADEELDVYLQSCWQPEVHVFNMVKEDVKREQIFVCEEEAMNSQQMIVLRQKIKGTFQTKMLLHEFPLDYQELPLTLYSRLPRDQVVLKQDHFEYSYINRDNMNDPQGWEMFSHVDIVEGNPNSIPPTNFFPSDNSKDEKKSKPLKSLQALESVKAITKNQKTFTGSGKSKNKHGIKHPNHSNLVSTMSSFLSARCRIKRRSQFYVLNILFAMLTLICLSFVPFSIESDKVHHRVVTTLTLLLTTFTFRSMISSLLPSTSYFTLLDKYLLGQTTYLSAMVINYGCLVAVYRNCGESVSSKVETIVLIIVLTFQFSLHAYLLNRFFTRRGKAKHFINECERRYEVEVKSILSQGPRRKFSTFSEKANRTFVNDSFSVGSATNIARPSLSSYIESSLSRTQSQSQYETISEGVTMQMGLDSDKVENGTNAVNKSVRFPIVSDEREYQ